MAFIDKIEIRDAINGEFYLVLVSDNNEDLFTGETYPEKEIANVTAEKVQGDIPGAEIIDYTMDAHIEANLPKNSEGELIPSEDD